MDKCNSQLLGAYLDGELAGEQRARVEEHLRNCAPCDRELKLLRDASRLLAEHPFQDITDRELKSLHEAIDSEIASRPIWRIGGALSVIAASVLIVSCAWLMEMPSSGGNASSASAGLQPWEHVAMTLRPDAPWQANDDTTQLADAQLADWMLDGLPPKVER